MDKIGKIRRKIEGLLNDWKYGSSTEAKYRCEVYKELLEEFDALQEEPVSEDLEKMSYHSAMDLINNPKFLPTTTFGELIPILQKLYKDGAKWQKAKDQETIELAEDHAMLAGMEKMREKIINAAIEWIRRNANINNFRWVSVFREAMNKV